MSPAVKHTLRIGITLIIVAMLVVFATRVNWHDTWRSITCKATNRAGTHAGPLT